MELPVTGLNQSGFTDSITEESEKSHDPALLSLSGWTIKGTRESHCFSTEYDFGRMLKEDN